MRANLHGEWEAYQNLDQKGDPWKALNELVDFEAFRAILEDCWRPAAMEPAKGGRPPYDAVLMFKLLVVGRKCGLSDEKLELAALDSLRIMRFLGLSLGARAPDRATIARYRSQLDEDTMRELFDTFHDVLEARGYEAKDGQMVDGSFMLAPIQRNTRDENASLKRGETPAAWKEDKATAKLRQKDVDARWTTKRGKHYFGYKNHICVDVGHKLIRGYVATPANVHDINVLEDLVDPTQPGQPLYADAAYRAKAVECALRARRIRSRVTFKRTKDQPLTSYQKRENKRRAKVRARVEHVFGALETAVGGKRMRCIGGERASIQIGLQNLIYNMCRLTYLEGAAKA